MGKKVSTSLSYIILKRTSLTLVHISHWEIVSLLIDSFVLISYGEGIMFILRLHPVSLEFLLVVLMKIYISYVNKSFDHFQAESAFSPYIHCLV